MAVVKLDHVSILCPYLEKTASFYTDILGFKRGYSKEDGEMKLVYLTRADDTVEIIEPLGEGTPKGAVFKHVAFASDDIWSDFEHFKQLGLRLLHDKVQEGEESYYFFLRAPGGEWIEIVQAKEASKSDG